MKIEITLKDESSFPCIVLVLGQDHYEEHYESLQLHLQRRFVHGCVSLSCTTAPRGTGSYQIKRFS